MDWVSASPAITTARSPAAKPAICTPRTATSSKSSAREARSAPP
jgi:hypothetical protein